MAAPRLTWRERLRAWSLYWLPYVCKHPFREKVLSVSNPGVTVYICPDCYRGFVER